MTLILALDCKEGLILASDSQGTLGAVRQDWPKIFTQHDNVAWGGAGNLGVVQRVREYLQSHFSHTSFNSMPVPKIRETLASSLTQVVRPLLTQRRPTERDDDLSEYLFVGHAAAGSFILHMSTNLLDTDYIGTGYHAIGSGGPFPLVALTGLGHYDIRNQTLRTAKLIAHRLMDDAIRVAAQGLGMPIQMIEIPKPVSGHGQARILLKGEIEELALAVTGWKQIEADSLARYLDIHVPTRAESGSVPPVSS